MVVPYGDPRGSATGRPTSTRASTWSASGSTRSSSAATASVEITYLDAVVCGETGERVRCATRSASTRKDFGILWKHTDIFNGSAQSRRQRRLVVSYFTTVGNYDYGFYWYFYLDGAIECEVKMTGIVFTAGHPGGDHPYSTEVAPGLGAPVHQHLFNARLDMSVDGLANAVEEVDVTGLPIGPDNPYGNAIARRVTRLDLGGDGSAVRRRVPRAGLAGAQHGIDEPVRPADRVHAAPGAEPGAAGQPGLAARAAGGLRLPRAVGDPLRPGAALPSRRLREPAPRWRRAARVHRGDRDIDGQDIVVWHTFGPTHVVRTEDWPVMPVTRTGFMLRPTGFFDRNPTLDVPAAVRALPR